MVEERKRSNIGVIIGIATAVIVAGGGGIAALNMMGNQGNNALGDPTAIVGADPTAVVQSAPTADPATPPAPLTPMQPGTATLSPAEE